MKITHVRDFAKEVGYPAVEHELEFAAKYARKILSESLTALGLLSKSSAETECYLYISGNVATIYKELDKTAVATFTIVRDRDKKGRFTKMSMTYIDESNIHSRLSSLQHMLKVCKDSNVRVVYVHEYYAREFNSIIPKFPTRM